MLRERETRWFVLKGPRRDINGGSETEVTVTSKLQANAERNEEIEKRQKREEKTASSGGAVRGSVPHRLDAPRVLASMVSLAGRQEARTSAKVPRANQTRCIGQPRIRARALTLGNLGGQVHKEPGRHRRLSTGYSGPRGCCVPVWTGGVTRQGRGVETSVCLIRFQFTGAPQTENGLQSHGRREEVRDLSGAGVNAYLGRVTDRGLPLPAVVDTPQRSHKAGCAGVGAGLRTGLSC